MPSILAQYFYKLRKIIEAEESLYEFAKQSFPHFESAKFVDGWHIQAICEHLEAVYRGEISNIIFNIPPRCMKTALISVIFPAWVWLHKPGEQFFCVGSSQDIVYKASEDSRTLVTSTWYQANWGNKVQLSSSQNTKERWKTTANGFRVSCTILGKIVGKGGNYLIIDDPNNTWETDKQRETINSIYSNSLVNRVNDLKNVKRILTMQRTHEKDMTGYLSEEEREKDWVKFVLPMNYDPDRKCKTIVLPSTKGRKWEDPRKSKGDLLWKDRFDKKSLKSLYSQLSPYIVSGQYQQRPSPDEGGIIKKAWFKPWSQKALPKINHIIQSWDTAFTPTDGIKDSSHIAYSVCTTWGVFRDMNGLECILLLAAWREKVDFHDLLAAASRLAKDYRDDGKRKFSKIESYMYKPDTVLVEALATGGPLLQELRRVGVAPTAFLPNKLGSKIDRVKLVSHLIRDGRVYLLARESGNFEEFSECFIDECATFPNGKYRDQVDTLTQTLAYLRQMGWLQHSEDEKEKNAPAPLKRLY